MDRFGFDVCGKQPGDSLKKSPVSPSGIGVGPSGDGSDDLRDSLGTGGEKVVLLVPPETGRTDPLDEYDQAMREPRIPYQLPDAD